MSVKFILGYVLPPTVTSPVKVESPFLFIVNLVVPLSCALNKVSPSPSKPVTLILKPDALLLLFTVITGAVPFKLKLSEFTVTLPAKVVLSPLVEITLVPAFVKL